MARYVLGLHYAPMRVHVSRIGALPTVARRMSPVPSAACAILASAASLGVASSLGAAVQADFPSVMDRVLVRTADAGPGGDALDVDRGAVGLWQQLLRLQTSASLLYTAGHPDDEQAGLLTMLARGRGVRTALLTLNRGEGGANAVGPELFDGLGLIRTEELRLAGRYYGLDDQYFTTAVDYGYSKTLDEAFRSWERERILADMVRIIRVNRPLVVVSRWHGSDRDGHGHHQAAGVLTPEAARAAGDPNRFPDQITQEGLSPWTPLRLYRGAVREGERADVVVDADIPSPWLGTTYEEFGRFGLSLQRSQTAGRIRGDGRPTLARYERLPLGSSDRQAPGVARALPDAGPVEAYLEPAGGFFAGMGITLGELPDLLGESVADSVIALLEATQDRVDEAVAAYRIDDPAATLESLAAGLRLLRRALTLLPDSSESRFHLGIKELQFQRAIGLAAGFRAWARALQLPSGDGTVVPGQVLEVTVNADFADPRVTLTSVALVAPPGWTEISAETASPDSDDAPSSLSAATPGTGRAFRIRVPAYESSTRPFFRRADLHQNHYRVADSTLLGLAERSPLLTAAIRFTALGVEATAHIPVSATQSDAPYGEVQRPITVVPAVTVTADPPVRVFPAAAPGSDRTTPLPIRVTLTNHHPDGSSGHVRLDVTTVWRMEPRSHPFELTAPGESQTFVFQVWPRLDATEDALLIATAAVPDTERGNQEFWEGFQTIEHRDLGTRRLYGDASVTLRAVDARLDAGLEVGYVMGVGDRVPDAIEQLGAHVTLLDQQDLASGDLSRFQTIMLGTRAYAVRPELVTHADRLLEWTAAGGNLVVLYQTQEFHPEDLAPHDAQLPPGAEEVSEEDAPVDLLAPEHPLLTIPNQITPEDFHDWVEQRGSKFFTEWDDAYTPLVETHDTGQAPQRGVWLTAPYGEGRYTYVALALHRQLPYGVPGAYRILANLLTPPVR